MQQTTTTTAPEWEGYIPESPRDLLMSIGREGLERLLFKPAAEQYQVVEDALVKALGFHVGDCMGSYGFDLAVEAGDLGLRLGLALGRLGGHLDLTASSFETWLEQAVQAAGLADYQPQVKLRLPE